MKFLFAAALALAAHPALAQAERPTLESVINEIAGREVAVAGRVVRTSQGFTLFSDFGWFNVDFAVDRATLERLRECPRIGNPNPCPIAAVGLLWFEGGQPNLTLSDVVFTD
jgi:hypothetical protein